MSEHTKADVYQQRFRSTNPVTDALNGLLKEPLNEFTFYAKKEYVPVEVKKAADEEASAYTQRIARRIIDIRNHSLRIGALSLQLAPPVDVLIHEETDRHNKSLELDFSAFAPAAYWKIMQEFHREEHPSIPSTSNLRELADRSLAVYLSLADLKQPEDFNVAANDLMQSLRDPAVNYKMHIIKLRGASDNQ